MSMQFDMEGYLAECVQARFASVQHDTCLGNGRCCSFMFSAANHEVWFRWIDFCFHYNGCCPMGENCRVYRNLYAARLRRTEVIRQFVAGYDIMLDFLLVSNVAMF